jgi:hypothetical protein
MENEGPWPGSEDTPLNPVLNQIHCNYIKTIFLQFLRTFSFYKRLIYIAALSASWL